MIFEEMKNPERKAAFLRRRGEAVNSDPAEVEAMAAYILTDRFDADLQRLIEGDWYFEPPSLIFLRKGKSQKRRKVYRFTDENRILLQYLSFMLFDRYDDRLPDTLYSFRKNKPCWQLFRSVRRSDPRREKYVIKADIHKFGESIDPGILEGKLKRWLSDEPEVCSFIMWLITRNVYYRKGKLEKGFTSVLPGNPTAAFLQNIFLEDIDRFMAENACVCSRYCDDIFMICEDPGTAGRLMDELGERIAGFGLSLNEEKSGVVPPGEAYDLLGIRFAPDAMDIADCTYAKICGRMKTGSAGQTGSSPISPRRNAWRAWITCPRNACGMLPSAGGPTPNTAAAIRKSGKPDMCRWSARITAASRTGTTTRAGADRDGRKAARITKRACETAAKMG